MQVPPLELQAAIVGNREDSNWSVSPEVKRMEWWLIGFIK